MRTSARVAAREAARIKQARSIEDRWRRQTAELELLGAFQTALDRGDDSAMASAVTALIALGNDTRAVAALTNQARPAVRRLRRLGAAANAEGCH